MGSHCSGALSFRCLGRERDEKEKWMRVHGGRDFSIVVEVCSNYCCGHENVLMCVYFDQSRAGIEGGWVGGGFLGRTREKSKQQREICSLSTEACLHLAIAQTATAHANCDHFSICISQLASELILKPPAPLTL